MNNKILGYLLLLLPDTLKSIAFIVSGIMTIRFIQIQRKNPSAARGVLILSLILSFVCIVINMLSKLVFLKFGMASYELVKVLNLFIMTFMHMAYVKYSLNIRIISSKKSPTPELSCLKDLSVPLMSSFLIGSLLVLISSVVFNRFDFFWISMMLRLTHLFLSLLAFTFLPKIKLIKKIRISLFILSISKVSAIIATIVNPGVFIENIMEHSLILIALVIAGRAFLNLYRDKKKYMTEKQSCID